VKRNHVLLSSAAPRTLTECVWRRVSEPEPASSADAGDTNREPQDSELLRRRYSVLPPCVVRTRREEPRGAAAAANHETRAIGAKVQQLPVPQDASERVAVSFARNVGGARRREPQTEEPHTALSNR